MFRFTVLISMFVLVFIRSAFAAPFWGDKTSRPVDTVQPRTIYMEGRCCAHRPDRGGGKPS
jgi:hypothetical protein